ncbi:excalibur calcium-binding domain-containing protein [Kitasatospora hibisci]|uniref:excalibur calcium-binding domain-containing protein n=1 Tax=Kitasatospora hibisci TaxID=3369522 RepID=UPI003754DB51
MQSGPAPAGGAGGGTATRYRLHSTGALSRLSWSRCRNPDLLTREVHLSSYQLPTAATTCGFGSELDRDGDGVACEPKP